MSTIGSGSELGEQPRLDRANDHAVDRQRQQMWAEEVGLSCHNNLIGVPVVSCPWSIATDHGQLATDS
jgi:hypothetical protein